MKVFSHSRVLPFGEPHPSPFSQKEKGIRVFFLYSLSLWERVGVRAISFQKLSQALLLIIVRDFRVLSEIVWEYSFEIVEEV
jgi:hypothetical protein